jgi:hypothetical protein
MMHVIHVSTRAWQTINSAIYSLKNGFSVKKRDLFLLLPFMKRIICLLFTLLGSFAKAQQCDSVFLTNGMKFLGRITEQNDKNITFRYCDSSDNSSIKSITVFKESIKRKSYAYYHIENISNLKRDTNTYFHIGIIPYQLLSRSSGIYIRYDFKGIGIEYRPTYTYTTNVFIQGALLASYADNFCFQGINNSLSFYFPLKHKTKIGIMLSYKYWWYNNQTITREYASSGG